MKNDKVYTISHGVVPIPNKWIIPGLKELKGNVDAIVYVTELACSKYGKQKEDVMKRTRKREFLKIRQIIQALLKNNFPKLTLSEIGEKCGNKDHATVLHSCRAVSNLFDTDKVFREEYQELNNMIKLNKDRFKQTHYVFSKRVYRERR